MIELENIVFAYDGAPALDGVSLKFEEGKCYAIEGPNGAGKSTLFRILNGLSFPKSGRYLLDGEEITEKKMNDRSFAQKVHRKVGYLFQYSETQLFTKSVEDEIAFGLYQLGYPEEKVKAETEKYLDLLHLQELRKRAPYNLSGGEKKRCALAAVLAMEPQVLIMDEPISGLDEDGQKWIEEFILSLRDEKRTILIATHQKEFSEKIADETIVLNKAHQVVNQ